MTKAPTPVPEGALKPDPPPVPPPKLYANEDFILFAALLRTLNSFNAYCEEDRPSRGGKRA